MMTDGTIQCIKQQVLWILMVQYEYNRNLYLLTFSDTLYRLSFFNEVQCKFGALISKTQVSANNLIKHS